MLAYRTRNPFGMTPLISWRHMRSEISALVEGIRRKGRLDTFSWGEPTFEIEPSLEAVGVRWRVEHKVEPAAVTRERALQAGVKAALLAQEERRKERQRERLAKDEADREYKRAQAQRRAEQAQRDREWRAKSPSERREASQARLRLLEKAQAKTRAHAAKQRAAMITLLVGDWPALRPAIERAWAMDESGQMARRLRKGFDRSMEADPSGEKAYILVQVFLNETTRDPTQRQTVNPHAFAPARTWQQLERDEQMRRAIAESTVKAAYYESQRQSQAGDKAVVWERRELQQAYDEAVRAWGERGAQLWAKTTTLGGVSVAERLFGGGP